MKTAEVDRRSASFFAVANLAAGGVHYAFQVWCSTQLDAVDFGEFNSWYAYFSLALLSSAFVQYLGNFMVVSARAFAISASAGVTAGILGVLIPFGLGSAAGGWSIAATGVGLALIFNWCLGQTQIRLYFYHVGTALLLAAASKFLLAAVDFHATSDTLSMAWAASVSYAPALIYLCLPIILRPQMTKPPQAVQAVAQGLVVTGILAVGSVLIPNLDIIVIHQTQNPEAIGQFARVSILYKAVFFSFLILAQWLLPYQLRAAGGEAHKGLEHFTSRPTWRLRVIFLLISFGMALFVYFMSDIFVTHFMGRDFSPLREWTLLSCFNMALLTNIFFHIQIDCVQRRPWPAGVLVAGLLGEMAAGMLLRQSVSHYLVTAISINGALWFLHGVLGSKRRAIQFAEQR